MKKIFIIGAILAVLIASFLVTALSNEEKFMRALSEQLTPKVLEKLQDYQKMNPEDAIRMALENYKKPKIKINQKESNEITFEVTRDLETEVPSEEPKQTEIIINEPQVQQEQLEIENKETHRRR